MTRKEAIAELKRDIELDNDFSEEYITAVNMAIKALEQESKLDTLDKIRAEIAEEKEHAYADFERYKVEYLGQDGEDVLDSLPQDDFRYGMERCIDIIDKYKAESEE